MSVVDFLRTRGGAVVPTSGLNNHYTARDQTILVSKTQSSRIIECVNIKLQNTDTYITDRYLYYVPRASI